MAGTVLLVVLLLVLPPLGAGCAVALIVGAFMPKYRRHVWGGAVWGVVGALLLAVPLTVIAELMTGGGMPLSRFVFLVAKGFFAGFALGSVIWYVFRFRHTRLPDA